MLVLFSTLAELMAAGNHLESSEHRLAQPRTTWAAPLPGQGLVVLDQPTGTVTDIPLTEDGEARPSSDAPPPWSQP